MTDKKTTKMEISTLPGGFRDWEKRFIDENIHFFNPNYFPIFQDGGPKNIKKGTFYITWGVFEVEENVLIYKNFHFFTPTYFQIFQDGGPKNI